MWRIRYREIVAPVGAHYRHCRMCQRAVGNAFAIFADFKLTSFGSWRTSRDTIVRLKSHGAVSVRDAARQFLTEYAGAATIGITIGSLDRS